MVQPLVSLAQYPWRVALPLAVLLAALLFASALPSSRRGELPLVRLLVFVPLTLLACWRSRWAGTRARRRPDKGPLLPGEHLGGVTGRLELRATASGSPAMAIGIVVAPSGPGLPRLLINFSPMPR
jgi:hypothetical protein